jgi:hypothetical protein
MMAIQIFRGRSRLPSPVPRVDKASVATNDDKVIGTLFVLIFPGYFVYHVAVAQGVIPAFLDGYSSAVAFLVFPLAATLYVKRELVPVDWRMPLLDVSFFVFVIAFAAVVFGNLLLGADQAIAVPHVGILIQFVSLFLLFRTLRTSQAFFRRLSALCFGLMSGLTFLHTSDGAFQVLSDEVDAMGQPLADYQGYAFVYLVVALCLLGGLRTMGRRLLVYLFAFSALYLIGARSEFVGFLFGAALIEYLYSPSRPAAAVLGAVFLGLLALLVTVPQDFQESRVLGILKYGEDQSASERRDLNQKALELIARSPLAGDYAGYGPGEYAHNVLSAWVDLGLPGFAAFLALLLAAGSMLFRLFERRSRSSPYVLALTILAVELLLVLAAKNYTYQLFPIAIALCAREISCRSTKAAQC